MIPGVRGRRNGCILGSAEAVEVRDLSTIPFPYTEEDMEDLEHKIIYYESSRGCPFPVSIVCRAIRILYDSFLKSGH